MKIKVIASTKVGYVLPKEEAIDFSGKSAGARRAGAAAWRRGWGRGGAARERAG